ncbi:MAG: permease-like cell division protein FtsX [Patescibacteria group bacterium]|nr:permease-like cell division protein FtsX [Patescibacteria group bacterium]MCL5431493.1 permease-like cell division protein FtsX [Patescibacteria group bacterium]
MSHQLTVTWQHIRRSPYQAAAAVMIMMLTTFVGLSFLILSLGSQRLLTYLEQKPQVIVFFNDTITAENQVADVEQKLVDTQKAASMKFVSKDEALQIYKQRNQNDPLLLELVTANTLPASLEVSATNVADLPTLYNIIKQASNIEDVSYQQDVVNNLIGILDKTRKFGVGVMIFLAATSLFTIVTIIGMKIALRKEEIDVENLVGASGWYIRSPFLLEGLFYGLVGGTASWAILMTIILLSTPALTPYLAGLSLLPLSPLAMLAILAAAVGSGAIVGVGGSFLAVWHYLKN